jgi:hypothetical protein
MGSGIEGQGMERGRPKLSIGNGRKLRTCVRGRERCLKFTLSPLEVSIRTYVSVRVRNIRDRSHEISFILASNSNGGFLPNPQTSLNVEKGTLALKQLTIAHRRQQLSSGLIG